MMTLVPFNVKEIPKRKNGYKKTKNLKVLEEFEASGHACVRVDNHHYRNEMTCRNTLTKSAKRFGMTHIKAYLRDGKVYLINTTLVDN